VAKKLNEPKLETSEDLITDDLRSFLKTHCINELLLFLTYISYGSLQSATFLF